MTQFVAALGGARLAIGRGRLILRKAHHERLQDILGAFGQFEIGKTHLIEIRSSRDLESNLEIDSIDRINGQIQANREYKNAYEGLLDQILPEFRRQLDVAA